MSDEAPAIPKTVFRDADAVRQTLLGLRTDVVAHRFITVKVKSLLHACGQTNGGDRGEATTRLVAALSLLNDMDEFQSSATWKGERIESVFVRAVDSNVELKDVMRIMYAPDVQAVCAMVQEGHRGVARASGLDSEDVLGWLRNGCKIPNAVAKLIEIIDYHQRCNAVLTDDPLSLSDFVDEYEQKKAERITQLDALQIIVQEEEENERQRRAEEEAARIKREQEEREAELERLRLENMLCPVCCLRSKMEGRRLCRTCEDAAISSALSDTGEVQLTPEFEEDRDWETPLEKHAARAAYDAGVEDPVSYHAIGAAIMEVEGLLAEHELSLADLGFFVNGYNNDESGEGPRLAQAVDKRRGDGRVVVDGMEFYPHRVRERLKAALGSLKVVSGIAETLVEEIESGGELREALGYEGSQQVSELDARVDEVTRDLKYLRTELVPKTVDERSESRRAR